MCGAASPGSRVFCLVSLGADKTWFFEQVLGIQISFRDLVVQLSGAVEVIVTL